MRKSDFLNPTETKCRGTPRSKLCFASGLCCGVCSYNFNTLFGTENTALASSVSFIASRLMLKRTNLVTCQYTKYVLNVK